MPSTRFTHPDTGASVFIGAPTAEERDAKIAAWWAEYNARNARRDYIAAVTEQARQALGLLDQIKAGNATFLAATPPGATAAQIQFLYTHMRAQAQAETVLANVTAGLISLFGVVVPALSDLLDEGGAD